MTPAARHYARHTAAAESAKAAESGGLRADATGYERMLAKLNADKLRLKQVQGVERKAEVKREILPDYVPYVQGVLASGAGVQDAVLMTVMVWCIDAGYSGPALAIAAYALHHRLALPDQYERTLGCLLAEEFADQALKAYAAAKPLDAAALLAVADLTQAEDMPDEVRAKLHKAIGYALAKSSPESALIHLRRALELHDKAGVKKDIERLERQLKAAPPKT